MSDSSRPHGLQHTRLPCPSPFPEVFWNSCPLSQWCHPTISSSVTPFSFGPQSFPASGSFPVSQLFASGGQMRASASASVLSVNVQGWCPLGWTGWISLQSKGLSRVFFSNTVFAFRKQVHCILAILTPISASLHIHGSRWTIPARTEALLMNWPQGIREVQIPVKHKSHPHTGFP